VPPPRCSFCDHENPAGASYCNECGSPLHLALCRCGAVNDLTDTQCYRCGAAVPGPATPGDGMPLEAELREIEAQLRGFEQRLDTGEGPAATADSQSAAVSPAPGQNVPFEHRLEEEPTPPAAVSWQVMETAPFQSDPAAAARGRRRPVYAAITSVLAIAATIAAAAILHDRYAPWLELGTADPAVASAPSGGPADAEQTPPEPSPIDEPARSRAGSDADGTTASAPASPIASASQPTDVPIESRAGSDADETTASPPVPSIASASRPTDVPIESRAESDAREPAAPVSAPPTPDPRCPPAVVAMALCERMVHADGR
jgi:hypothetical protein